MYHYKLNFAITYFLLIAFQGISQPLKLMTYNVRLDVAVDGENKWDNRKELFTGLIKFHEPDILGIQESLPNQVSYLSSNLLNFRHVGIAREGNNKGESSSIFYNFYRLELNESNTFWLSPTPDMVSIGWDASYLRVCTYALFTDKKTNRQFWVFNTHLDNNGIFARKKSVELILKKINSTNSKKLPVFFMGDFNSSPNDEIIVQLKNEMNDAQEISLALPYGPAGSFNNFEFNKPVTQLIDYIFIAKKAKLRVDKYAILSDSYNLKYPSDHLPVFVQISWKDKPFD
ncbi:MAG: endonuclease/exonuclease/phosphatase family protein [Bacteroidetes bacterium]|nr:endonuclease/exonuclease/phosphatase family protein [Bacteroidota bacterium]